VARTSFNSVIPIEWFGWATSNNNLVTVLNTWWYLLVVTTRVMLSRGLDCCLLPYYEALRTCRSGFAIATILWNGIFSFCKKQKLKHDSNNTWLPDESFGKFYFENITKFRLECFNTVDMKQHAFLNLMNHISSTTNVHCCLVSLYNVTYGELSMFIQAEFWIA